MLSSVSLFARKASHFARMYADGEEHAWDPDILEEARTEALAYIESNRHLLDLTVHGDVAEGVVDEPEDGGLGAVHGDETEDEAGGMRFETIEEDTIDDILEGIAHEEEEEEEEDEDEIIDLTMRL